MIAISLSFLRLLQEYFGLYAELLSYMGQVEKHVRKGYSKFVLARADDPALLLGTGSYAGREMRPLVTIEEYTANLP